MMFFHMEGQTVRGRIFLATLRTDKSLPCLMDLHMLMHIRFLDESCLASLLSTSKSTFIPVHSEVVEHAVPLPEGLVTELILAEEVTGAFFRGD